MCSFFILADLTAAMLVRDRNGTRYLLLNSVYDLIGTHYRRHQKDMVSNPYFSICSSKAFNHNGHDGVSSPVIFRSPLPRIPSILWTCTCSPTEIAVVAAPMGSP